MMAEKVVGDKIYIAIDCNHRLMAYKSLGIKTAKCLVFPHLPTDIYNRIACNFLFYLVIANELHGSYAVQVTPWEQFKIVSKYFELDTYRSRGGFSTAKIAADLVSFTLFI